MPHPEQKRDAADIGAPHPGHAAPSRVAPQLEQNFPEPGVAQAGQTDNEPVMASGGFEVYKRWGLSRRNLADS